MIKLKNIVIENNIVICDIFPEDSVENGTVKIDMHNSFTSVVFPKGYEWCKNHIDHAKEYLINLYNSKSSIPNEKVIMWY